MSIYSERIKELQKLLKLHQCDFCIIPSLDPHASEYLPDFYKCRAMISGFSGSAGVLLVGVDDAILFTDGRYFIQAQIQLENSNIRLNKGIDYLAYLKENHKSCTIAIDDSVFTYSLYQELQKDFELKMLDLASLVYERKPLVFNKPYLQNPNYVSKSAKDKIKTIQDILKHSNIDHNLISSLDDIAYLTNLRGLDVKCNPVFLSYLLISTNECVLFANNLDDEIKEYLISQDIKYKPYAEVFENASLLKGSVLIDYSKTATKLANCIKCEKINKINPSTVLKSCKDENEIKNIKQAHIEDGVALLRFYKNLEERIKNKEKINEYDIDGLLSSYRKLISNYVSDSFSTIAAFNENAAIVHYKASKTSSKLIDNGVLLIDSGAQYHNGTTDITRVFVFGGVSDEFKNDYTLVLKSHIAMASLVVKKDTLMPYLDVLARSVLWEKGLDYRHGTGHGVGYFLNVHEGPQVLSVNAVANENMAVKEGMITSIEPGLYHTDKYGIRLENLYALKHKISSEYGEFLEFDVLSLYPFELDLINQSMLNEKEKEWINNYHNLVKEKLSPYLNEEECLYLESKTRKL